MIIFKETAAIRNYIATQKAMKHRAGFIPTMGALHDGHRSLIQKARAECDLTICSIFVNPTQFNDKSDFDKYPVTVEADIKLLIDAGCDVLFLPSVEEIYPEGLENAKTYDFGYLDTILEGAMRPGHFRGVGQVVAALINSVIPDALYLGQKDYQQCVIITRLIEQMGQDIQIVVCPTVREADGLAMSSRNRRLTEPQRSLAGVIYQCLISIQSKQSTASFEIVKKECIDLLAIKGFQPEYVVIADARSLLPLNEYNENVPSVGLIAVRLGEIRLIDNIVL